MKKIGLIIISLVSIIFITGCSTTKNAVLSDDFVVISDNLNLDIIGVGSSYGFAEDAYKVDDSNYSLLYIEGKKLSDITGMFYDDIKNVYSTLNDVDIKDMNKQSKTGKNWKSFEMNKNGIYYYIIYVDNTYLYLKYNDSSKELMNQLRDAMKY